VHGFIIAFFGLVGWGMATRIMRMKRMATDFFDLLDRESLGSEASWFTQLPYVQAIAQQWAGS
jgi:hypothetical protein